MRRDDEEDREPDTGSQSLEIDVSVQQAPPSALSSFRESLSRALSISGEKDDEELELKWAVIERLPTSNRLHMALLHRHGEVVDVRSLGVAERRQVVDTLISSIHCDNLRLLQKQRQRMDSVGVRPPTVEVRWRDVCVEAECQVVQGKPLPTVWNAVVSNFEMMSSMVGFKRQKARIRILNNVSGIVKPPRLTLLLGPPGCGKSTLLRALAGKLDADLKATGDIEYNGVKLEEFVPEKTAAYISQYDLHVPEMTVRETLDFSARFQGVGTRAGKSSALFC
jgi:ABC-type glutathione transport system ATPase component